MWFALVAAAGLALGLSAALTDEFGSGLSASAGLRAAGIIVNAGSIWAGAATVAGLSCSSRTRSAWAGVTVSSIAVIAYYCSGVLVGDRQEVGFSGLSTVLRWWLLASVVLGPVLGWVGWVARGGGVGGLIARLVVPVGVIVEFLVRFRPDLGAFDYDPVWAWTIVGVVILAVLSALGITLAWAVQQNWYLRRHDPAR